MNSFRKHFFPAPICSSLVSHLHNSVRNDEFRHDEKRTGAEYHGSAQLKWIFQRARTERELPCEQAFTHANRRQRRRTRAFFSFKPVLPLLCTGYSNTKRRFLRGSEPRCARSPVRFPPASPPRSSHRAPCPFS